MSYKVKTGGKSIYGNIINPENNKSVDVNSKLGEEILDNYLKFLHDKTGDKLKYEQKKKYSKDVLLQIAYETIDFVNMNKDLAIYKKIVKIPYVGIREKDPLLDSQKGGENTPTINDSLTSIKKIITSKDSEKKNLEDRISELQDKLSEINSKYETLRKKIGDFVINEQGEIILSANLKLRQYSKKNILKIAKIGIQYCKKNKSPNQSEFCKKIINLINPISTIPEKESKTESKAPTSALGMLAATQKKKFEIAKKKINLGMKKKDIEMKESFKKQEKELERQERELKLQERELNNPSSVKKPPAKKLSTKKVIKKKKKTK